MVKRKTIIGVGIALIIGTSLLRRDPEERRTVGGGGSGGIFSFLTQPGGQGKKETLITTTTEGGQQPLPIIPALPEAPPGFFDEPEPLATPVPSGFQSSLDQLRARLGIQTQPELFQSSLSLADFSFISQPPPSKKESSLSSFGGAIPQQTISPFKAPTPTISSGFTSLSSDPGAVSLRQSLSLEGATSTSLKKDTSIGTVIGSPVLGGSSVFGGG